MLQRFAAKKSVNPIQNMHSLLSPKSVAKEHATPCKIVDSRGVGLHPTSQKIRKPKKTWNDGYLLLKVEPPVLNTNEKLHKKYSVRITYMDENRRRKNKTVFFGDKEKQDYVDHKDETRRLSAISRLGKSSDPFNKDFWKLNLLNNKESVSEAYSDVLAQLNLL